MKAFYLSLKPKTPKNDYWDYGFLNDFISGRLWQPPGFEKFETYEVDKLSREEKAIVIIPARHHADMVTEINKELSRIKKVVLFLMGDEEADFPVEKIAHENIHIWIQNPHVGRHDQYNKLGTTYPPKCSLELRNTKFKKKLDIFFAGQITHQRREELSEILEELEIIKKYKMKIIRSKGFTQGEPQEDYIKDMSQAKIVPCPSGAVIPDSFRLFEALECMAIPIGDERTPDGEIVEYWDWLFNEEAMFPRVINWDRLYGLIIDIKEDYPRNLHQQTAWWIKQKRSFAHKVIRQLNG